MKQRVGVKSRPVLASIAGHHGQHTSEEHLSALCDSSAGSLGGARTPTQKRGEGTAVKGLTKGRQITGQVREPAEVGHCFIGCWCRRPDKKAARSSDSQQGAKGTAGGQGVAEEWLSQGMNREASRDERGAVGGCGCLCEPLGQQDWVLRALSRDLYGMWD